MQFLGTLCTIAIFILSLFAMIEGIILQRQRYWNKVWERLGKPGVASIKELKVLNNRQRRTETES